MRNVFLVMALSAGVAAAAAPIGVAQAQSTDPAVQAKIDALLSRNPANGDLVLRGGRPGGAAAAPAATPTAAPAAVATPTPGRKMAAAPAYDTNAPAVDETVLFVSGSAELTPDAKRSLDILGRALASPQLATARFRIEGHTDTVGTRASNLELSSRRAAAVAEFLSHTYGIDLKRLQSVGVGQEQLQVPTGDQVNEPRNRRVRVINLSC